jgi:hypothetical protein
MFLPGILITILTFPGVIVHELAHQLFCRWCKVPVFEVVYFQAKNPAGYVLHEATDNPVHSTLISTGPFLVNTVLAFLIGFPAALQYEFGAAGVLDYLLLYFGISIGTHAFPSTGDAQALWASVMRPTTPILARILIAPVVGLIYLGAIGSMFWLDIIYGFAIAVGLPMLLIKAIM